MKALILTRDVLSWRSVVASMGVDIEVLSLHETVRGEVDVLLVDARHGQVGAGLLPLMEERSSVCVVLSDKPWSSRRREFRSHLFQAERYGSLFIRHMVLSVAAPGAFSWPTVTHGPGVRGDQGRPVLWSTQPYRGLGVPVGRDDQAVVSYIYEALQGHRTLWFTPGFPGLLPPCPEVFRALDGSVVTGALCASSDRPGGWVVLRLEELRLLLGYSDHPVSDWDVLQQIIPMQAAYALLSWLLPLSNLADLSVPPSTPGPGAVPGSSAPT